MDLKFSTILRRPASIAAFVVAMLAAVSLAGWVTAGDHDQAIDTAMIRAERVEAAIPRIDAMIDTAAERIAQENKVDASQAKQLLAKAAEGKFDQAAWTRRIRDAWASTDKGDIDGKELGETVDRLNQGFETLARIARDKDEAEAEKIRARLDAGADHEAIRTLAGLMAQPELAADTGSTGIYVHMALKAFSTVRQEELEKASDEQLLNEIKTLIGTLRDASKGEGGYMSPAAAVSARRDWLSMALATLKPEDVTELLRLYQSQAGKARRDALVTTFRQLTDEANTGMLSAYLHDLRDYRKSHPKP